MTMRTFEMAMSEPTLTGDHRLALFAFGDSTGIASVKTVSEWCNVSADEAQEIIDDLHSAGWLRYGYVREHDFTGYYQPDMIEAQAEYDNSRVHAKRSKSKPKPPAASWPIPQSLRKRIYARDGNKCHYCGSTQRLSLDHVVPQSRGGPHTDDNLVTCCKSCNSAKRDKGYLEFWATLS
ncbi:HNH endonuclease [uncultured Sulfitobacter sp.]|uniref:HNH endonuclease n=1 Tax=uncultured Sulfitobacter sp. TaxID=191468 RepID=UPI0030D79FF0|tara:strand:+ start:60 stop:596 length:537 start_codon:yes stop_codon:yes gene_type:complete